MSTTWLRYRSALALSFLFPWFPFIPSSPPEKQPPAVVGDARAASEPQPAASAPEEPVMLPGVVIEEIPKGSALEKAGLQVGDVILSWERLPNPPANPEGAQGELITYFDWLELEGEQAPRGAVVLRGRRDGNLLELRVEPGVWDAKVRPALSRALDEFYLTGKAQIASGNIEAAVQLWRSLASSAKGKDGGTLQAWITLLIGRAWEERGDWAKALESFRSAYEEGSNPTVQIAALDDLGEAYRSQKIFDAAEKAWLKRLKIWQTLHPESIIVANMLNDLGLVAHAREDLDSSYSYYLNALRIYEQHAPQSLSMASALGNLGIVARLRGELESAQGYLLRSLEIQGQLIPESLETASTFNNLGVVAWARDELDAAHNYFLRSLRIREHLIPNTLTVSKSLHNLGFLGQLRGDLASAQDYFLRSLKIREEVAPRSLDVAGSLNNLGYIAALRGELDSANDYYSRALEIEKQVAPGSLAASTSLSNLGTVARSRGELDRAYDYLLQALVIDQQVAPKSLQVAESLSNLGTVALTMGNLDRAQAFYLQALHLRKKLAPHGQEMAQSLNHLGLLASARRDLNRAHNYYNLALRHLQSSTLREQLEPKSLEMANTLYNLGDLARTRRALDDAYNFYNQALRIVEQIAPGSFDMADTLHSLGDVLRARGELDQAREHYVRALDGLEQQSSRLGASYKVQIGFRSQYGDFYRDLIDLLLTQRRYGEAFQFLEHFRAQTFLIMLAERDTVFTADIPEELDGERRRLSVRYDRAMKKLAGLNPRAKGREIEATRRELQKLDDAAGDIEARIRQVSPRLAALQYPHPLNTAEIQQAVDPGTLLLSYNVGKKKTTLFALSRSRDLEVKTLPLGDKALRSRVKQLLSLIREAAQGSSLGPLRQQRLQAASRKLYAALLGSVEERVAVSDRLLILPDGPLHALPFAALMRDQGQYLAEWKPLHVALSATVFTELKQRRHPASEKVSEAPIQIAAFGDPIYPQSLTKSKGVAVAALSAGAGAIAQTDAPRADPIVRSAAERGVFDWPPLPYTRHEVEGIARLFPAGSARTFLGSEALEEKVKSLDPKTRILHLAAHGYTDEHLPSSSFVALTIPGDTNPDAVQDRDNGLLQVWEIFEKVRLDADLVVLSACDTGLGEEQGGEGLIGLTRAFQYAGARTVVASLWSVQDQATSELMIRFYKHLRAGLSKDEALRQAQVELIRGPIEVVNEKGEKTLFDASAPYFWAGFQVYGDWQ